MDGHRGDGRMYGWEKTLKKLGKKGSEMRAVCGAKFMSRKQEIEKIGKQRLKRKMDQVVQDSTTWSRLEKQN